MCHFQTRTISWVIVHAVIKTTSQSDVCQSNVKNNEVKSCRKSPRAVGSREFNKLIQFSLQLHYSNSLRGLKSDKTYWIEGSNKCRCVLLFLHRKQDDTHTHKPFYFSVIVLDPPDGWKLRVYVCFSNDCTVLCKDVIMSFCSHTTSSKLPHLIPSRLS